MADPAIKAIINLLILFAQLIATAVTALFAYFTKNSRGFRAIQMANIDSMTGIDFERYLKDLLTTQGYSVRMTQASGDFGVDLVASRNTDKIAIQVKRYNNRVSRRAVSDAVAGMQHYRCNKAMVITNNYFTPDAITLARSTNCILADRNTLARWLVELQNTRNQHDKAEHRKPIVLIASIAAIIVLVAFLLSSNSNKSLSIPENYSPSTNTISNESRRSNSSVSPLDSERQYWHVNTKNLNLRQYPGVNQPVFQILPMNTKVVLSGEQRKVGDSTWVKVKTIDGAIQEGWVNQTFLQK